MAPFPSARLATLSLTAAPRVPLFPTPLPPGGGGSGGRGNVQEPCPLHSPPPPALSMGGAAIIAQILIYHLGPSSQARVRPSVDFIAPAWEGEARPISKGTIYRGASPMGPTPECPFQ